VLFCVDKCQSDPLAESGLVLGVARLNREEVVANGESLGAVMHDRAEIVRLAHVVDGFGRADLKIALGAGKNVGEVDIYVVIAVSTGLLMPEAECMGDFVRHDAKLKYSSHTQSTVVTKEGMGTVFVRIVTVGNCPTRGNLGRVAKYTIFLSYHG
jgi:hypothetical protein